MKEDHFYSIAELAADDTFIQWCLEPTKELDEYWEKWEGGDPIKSSLVDEARNLVLDLQTIESDQGQISLHHEIWNSIEDQIAEKKPIASIVNFRSWSSIAAGVCMLISIGLGYWIFAERPIQPVDKIEWITQKNETANQIQFQLSDGSRIELGSFSTLKYPREFDSKQRNVLLQGEAFFDIERDTLRPFLVYANETITKVLGTSFRIKAFEGQETVEVDVISGKVAVYARVASEDGSTKREEMIFQADEKFTLPLPNKKLEVLPNHKVIFDRKVEAMTRRITELPRVIGPVEKISQTYFRNASLSKVLSSLERIYGVDIEFDEQNIGGCRITTKLENKTLFQELEILESALDLKIVREDERIRILGSCK